MNSRGVVLILLYWSSALVAADTRSAEVEPGLDAGQRFAYFSRLARDNNPAAQYQLGRMYATGRGTPRNYVTARHWYRLAADQGSLMAQYRLAVLLYRGLGGEADAQEARKLFAVAARRGYAGAQFMLGNIYSQGMGGEASPKQARFWYQQAAANGHQSARAALSRLAGDVAEAQGTALQPAANLLVNIYKQEWSREDNPAQILPSAMTRCEWRAIDELECMSDTMFRHSGTLDILYQTRARIMRTDTGLSIRYRNNILDVRNNAGKDPATSALGWQHQEHLMQCRSTGPGSLSCSNERGEQSQYSSQSLSSSVVQSRR